MHSEKDRAPAPPDTSARTPTAVDVVIVGAGVAGIAAASEFIDRGFSVCVVEARSIIGGRARSWKDGKTKDPVSIGPHVLLTTYSNFFKLLRRLKTDRKVTWQPKRHFITLAKGQRTYSIKSTPLLSAPLKWALGSFWDPFTNFADKHTMVPALFHCLTYDTEEKLLELDNESGEQFLRRLGVSDASIYHFFAFLSHAILNVPIREVSATALVRAFNLIIAVDGVDMGFPACGLGELLTPAHELLFNNNDSNKEASLLLNTQVTGFTMDDSGSEQKCTGVSLDDGRTIEARMGVISTLPPQDLGPLLPSEWMQKHPLFRELEKFKPCKYIAVYLWFDRKVSRGNQMWARVYSEKDLNCEFYEYSQILSGTDAHGAPWSERPSFIGSNIIDAGRLGDDVSDEELVAGTLRELEELYGTDIREARVVHSMVNRVPMGIHRPVVGTERLRPDQATPVPGLYLAGCWTNTGSPACMESAARGGYLAVDRLLEQHFKAAKALHKKNGGDHSSGAHNSNSTRRKQNLNAEKRTTHKPAALPIQQLGLAARAVSKIDLLRPLVLHPFFTALSWISGGATNDAQPRSKL